MSDRIRAKDIFDLAGCHGEVVEVENSPRRSRMGKRSSFARFVNMEDGRMLAVRLDNILIDGKKIHVNIPRFGKKKRTTFGTNRGFLSEEVQRGPNFMFRRGASFKEDIREVRKGKAEGARKFGTFADIVREGDQAIIPKE